jgi:hypothetical protein
MLGIKVLWMDGGKKGGRWRLFRDAYRNSYDGKINVICDLKVLAGGLSLGVMEQSQARLPLGGEPWGSDAAHRLREQMRKINPDAAEAPGEVILGGIVFGKALVSSAACKLLDTVETGIEPLVLVAEWETITFDIDGASETLSWLREVHNERVEHARRWKPGDE